MIEITFSRKIIAVAIACTIIALICLTCLALDVQFDYIAKRDAVRKGQCTVLDKKIEARCDDEGSCTYDAELHLYLKLELRSFSTWVLRGGYYSRSSAQNVLANYDIGDGISCYYHPENPQATLSTSDGGAIPVASKWGVAVITIIAFIALVVAIFSWGAYISYIRL